LPPEADAKEELMYMHLFIYILVVVVVVVEAATPGAKLRRPLRPPE
jgi:hypothetical protein